MNNKSKIILDLCGGTGGWSRPYDENGYTVYIITHPKFDVFNNTKVGGTITFHGRDDTITIKREDIYGIFAAPTCTHFSIARTNAKEPRDLETAMKLVRECLEIIWWASYDDSHKLAFWALENPQGLLRRFLGRPYYTFSPEEFGEHYSKKTDLWGWFNFPKKNKYTLTEDEKLLCSMGLCTEYPIPEDYERPDNFTERQIIRSITPPKFAQAFYEANK